MIIIFFALLAFSTSIWPVPKEDLQNSKEVCALPDFIVKYIDGNVKIIGIMYQYVPIA